MKIIVRAAGVGIATTAIMTLLAPAAGAATQPRWDRDTGRLVVCVFGIDRHDSSARVDIDGNRGRDIRTRVKGCETFRLSEGRYNVDVDPPRGYRIGDDSENVRVRENRTAYVSFRVRGR